MNLIQFCFRSPVSRICTNYVLLLRWLIWFIICRFSLLQALLLVVICGMFFVYLIHLSVHFTSLLNHLSVRFTSPLYRMGPGCGENC
jgi:hypothetical protein